MRTAISFIVIIFFATFTATAQYKVVPNMPFSTLNTDPGYILINEITGGFGLGKTSTPYSKYFFGFTSISGYQVNKNFIFGAGTGLYFYESGLLVPLFLDFRFSFHINHVTPYIFGDGGLLLNISNFNGTKLFINPGVGAIYTLSKKVALNLGAGILSQAVGAVRDSFINLKLGVIYKF